MEEIEKNEEKTEQKTEKKKSWMRDFAELIITLIIVYAISMLIVTYVGQRTIVDGPSMQNTLQDGDNLIVNKIGYRFSDPKRFDIVVFDYLYEENTEYIKRIIGLPGETVQIIDGTIYINGDALEENFGKEEMVNAGIAAVPIELGEDEYFVLGDNRNHSKDSRDPLVGKVKRSQIVGKAWIRIWPFGSDVVLK